jgi:probable rRNA maturation factor
MERWWATSFAMWNEPKLARLSGKIMRMLRVKNATLDIFLLDNKSMTRLKARFIKKRTEPNVLAFPEPAYFPHPETKSKYLGEIYMNRDILKRSPERAKALLVHGILHLLGYDHKKKADLIAMEAIEGKILKKL